MSDTPTSDQPTRVEVKSERRIFALGRIAAAYVADESPEAFDRALDAAYDAGRLSRRDDAEREGVGRAVLSRVNKAIGQPYNGGIWEGKKFNESDFVTVRKADLQAILATLATPEPAAVALPDNGLNPSNDPGRVEIVDKQLLRIVIHHTQDLDEAHMRNLLVVAREAFAVGAAYKEPAAVARREEGVSIKTWEVLSTSEHIAASMALGTFPAKCTVEEALRWKSERADSGVSNIIQKLRTTAGQLEREGKRERGWSAAPGQARLMRSAADLLAAFSSPGADNHAE